MNKKLVSSLFYVLILVGGLAFGFLMPRLYVWFQPGYTEGNYSEYFQHTNAKVVLFGTKWCGYCAKTRDYFRKNNIAFQDVDIESSATAAMQFAKLGEGSSIPKVLIGNRQIVGFKPKEFESAIKIANK